MVETYFQNPLSYKETQRIITTCGTIRQIRPVGNTVTRKISSTQKYLRAHSERVLFSIRETLRYSDDVHIFHF